MSLSDKTVGLLFSLEGKGAEAMTESFVHGPRAQAETALWEMDFSETLF